MPCVELVVAVAWSAYGVLIKGVLPCCIDLIIHAAAVEKGTLAYQIGHGSFFMPVNVSPACQLDWSMVNMMSMLSEACYRSVLRIDLLHRNPRSSFLVHTSCNMQPECLACSDTRVTVW